MSTETSIDLLALLDGMEGSGASDDATPARGVAPPMEPETRRHAGFNHLEEPDRQTTCLGQPVGWRDELPRELDVEMREMGCHSSGKSVEVLRVVQTMVNASPKGQRSASCFIQAIARRAGLRVTTHDDPVDWSQYQRGEEVGAPTK